MIAKKLDPRGKNKVFASDSYRAVAQYIVGLTEQKPEEKVLASWFINCDGENFMENMMEIEAVQDLNTTAERFKTYHLMVSFRPEDEDKLTSERLEAIEQKFALALRLEQHQRCCGIHKNTNNVHIHVAYNLINPNTFNIHEPYRDYFKLAKACREIEQEYGLVVDRGLEEGNEPTRPNITAQTVEAQTGQESFAGYLQRHQPALLESLAAAENWQDVHKAFAEYGIGVKPGSGRKGGLLLYDLHNKKYQAKASSLSRSTSGPAMQKRFGDFAAPVELQVSERERYSKRPLQQEPNRGNLYDNYRAEMAEKSKDYAEFFKLKDAAQELRAEIYEKWNKRRDELKNNYKLSASDRWRLIQEVYLKRSEELATDEKLLAATEAKDKKIQKINEQYPFSSWTGFLKKEALQGNETALAILRSKKIAVEPAHPEHRPAVPPRSEAAAQRRQEILNNSNLKAKDKKRQLAAVKLMEKLNAELKLSVSPSGVLIMALPTGGTIRDNGKRIYFSSFDREANHAARKYAEIRWGKLAKQADENSYTFSPERKQDRGLGR